MSLQLLVGLLLVVILENGVQGFMKAKLRGKNYIMCSSGDLPEYGDPLSMDLNSLFTIVKEYEEANQEVPDDVKNAIGEKISMNAPSGNEARLQILGLNNPITQAGFALAFLLITLNTVLGTGWLGRLLGVSEDSSFVVVDERKQRMMESNDDDSLRFDYQEFQNRARDLNLNSDQPIQIEDDRNR